MATRTTDKITSSELPVVRPDRKGYVLHGDRVDGFADRPKLPVAARRQIAALAQRYAPEELSKEQRTLLASRPARRASALLHALAEDQADLDEAFAENLYDMLDAQQLALARTQTYPLAIGEVSELTRATPRQLRHWEENGLLRSYQLARQRRYLRGGVLRAMALVKQEQHVLATLSKTANEPTQFVKLLGLALRDSPDRAKVAAAAKTFTAVGKMLDGSITTVRTTTHTQKPGQGGGRVVPSERGAKSKSKV